MRSVRASVLRDEPGPIASPGLRESQSRFGTPLRTTILTGVVVAVIATFVPLTELADLVNMGTLFAFTLVAVGVPCLGGLLPARRTAQPARDGSQLLPRSRHGGCAEEGRP